MATRRAQQADDTRRRLFAAAAELFAVHGYHETTVDQIVRRAGVAKGTFFLHFATKDAVITELVRKQVKLAARVRESAQTAVGATPLDALRAVIMTLGEQAAGSRGLSRAMLAATLENPRIGGDALFGAVHAGLLDDVRAAQQAGQLAAGQDPKTIASALLAAYLGAAVLHMSSARARPLADTLGPLLDSCLEGFRKEIRHVPPPRDPAAISPARARRRPGRVRR